MLDFIAICRKILYNGDHKFPDGACRGGTGHVRFCLNYTRMVPNIGNNLKPEESRYIILKIHIKYHPQKLTAQRMAAISRRQGNYAQPCTLIRSF